MDTQVQAHVAEALRDAADLLHRLGMTADLDDRLECEEVCSRADNLLEEIEGRGVEVVA